MSRDQSLSPGASNQTADVQWRASWCWCSPTRGLGLETGYFRHVCMLDRAPDTCQVHLSADNRYRFYVNGTRMGTGPLKGNQQRYYFDSYDIAGLLKAGTNVLAVEVHHFGIIGPQSMVGRLVPGFIFQGPDILNADTPGTWRCMAGRAVTADTTSYLHNSQAFHGFMERVDAALLPHGWMDPDFDDAGWIRPVRVIDARPDAHFGKRHRIWHLQPRDLPNLVEEPRPLRMVAPGGSACPPGNGDVAPIHIPAGECREIVFTAGHLTTGYPRFHFTGGAGRGLAIQYAESVYSHIGEAPENDFCTDYRKTHRDNPTGGKLAGYQDTVLLDGRAFSYEPLHWRTFWHITLKVEAGPEPLVIIPEGYRFTTFPFTLRSDFTGPESIHQRIFQVSWRTLQLCSHETFEDCPYYEQINYILDARIAALTSYVLTGDRRLGRSAISRFVDSFDAAGMIESREPSNTRQCIPVFALWWIRMLHDYWMWFGHEDGRFVGDHLLVAEGILRWFRSRLNAQGLVGPLPFWNPIGGEGAPGCSLQSTIYEGNSTYVACLLLQAIRDMVDLYLACDEPQEAQKWRTVAATLRDSIRRLCWSDADHCFTESPGRREPRYSQHTQAHAILSGAAGPDQLASLGGAMLDVGRFVPMTRQAGLSLAEALLACGRADALNTQLVPEFREMLDWNLSTTVEEKLNSGRSDCHAWSAWMPVAYLTIVLGIQPVSPGFRDAVIRPAFIYPQAGGTLATPQGPVQLSWASTPDDGVRVRVRTPAGMNARLILPGMEPVALAAGFEHEAVCSVSRPDSIPSLGAPVGLARIGVP